MTCTLACGDLVDGEGGGHKQLTNISFKILFPYLIYGNPTTFLTESPWGLNEIMHADGRLQCLAYRGCWLSRCLYHLVLPESRVCFAVQWALNGSDLIWEGSVLESYLIQTFALINRNSVLNCCWKVRNLIWGPNGEGLHRILSISFLQSLDKVIIQIIIIIK